jgi:hypothetical protein
MRPKTNPAVFFLCALFVMASTARAQVYEFQFLTSAPGFGGELFFNAPAGSAPAGEALYGDSFITTPDGTFIGSESFAGGPIPIFPPPIVWSPAGITTINLSLYESLNSRMYNWTVTATSIADSPVSAIPLDPGASGTWVYIGAVPEPGAILLIALGAAMLLFGPSATIQHFEKQRSTGESFPAWQFWYFTISLTPAPSPV